MRLLLIEDDELLGDGLSAFLRAEGHVVDWCRSLAELHARDDGPFDAWLVDWQLPDGSGIQWLKQQRARGDATPAIVLTARDRLDDRVAGLDAGADDYLVKPVAPEELAARLRSLGRRLAAQGASLQHFGEVAVDLAARSVTLAGQRITLTAREWGVLEALVRRAGRIVTKPELERLVLGGDAAYASNSIEVHVSSLRRKLGPELIQTERGLGYRVTTS